MGAHDEAFQGSQLGIGMQEIVVRDESQTPRVMPNTESEDVLGGWTGLSQNFAPHIETRVSEKRCDSVEVVLSETKARLARGARPNLERCWDCDRMSALERGRCPEQMKVLRTRGDGFQPLGPALSDVVLVGGDRTLDGVYGVVVTTDAHVDVGGKVNREAG
jgi:hypothetical protein